MLLEFFNIGGQKSLFARGGKFDRIVDLGCGRMGNGLTVWDRNKQKYGDYKIVAHISEDGKTISFYDKELPQSAKDTIDRWAQEEAILHAKRYEEVTGKKLDFLHPKDEFKDGGELKVGHSEAGYTIKGKKGAYYIDDVQQRLPRETYTTFDELKDKFDRIVKRRKDQSNQPSSGPSQETLIEADRFYEEGGDLFSQYRLGGGMSGLKAPEGTVFVKSTSHRGIDKIAKSGIDFISLYKIGGYGGASTAIYLIKEKDFDKIKDINGISKQLSLSGDGWFSRHENTELDELCKNANPKKMEQGGVIDEVDKLLSQDITGKINNDEIAEKELEWFLEANKLILHATPDQYESVSKLIPKIWNEYVGIDYPIDVSAKEMVDWHNEKEQQDFLFSELSAGPIFEKFNGALKELKHDDEKTEILALYNEFGYVIYECTGDHKKVASKAGNSGNNSVTIVPLDEAISLNEIKDNAYLVAQDYAKLKELAFAGALYEKELDDLNVKLSLGGALGALIIGAGIAYVLRAALTDGVIRLKFSGDSEIWELHDSENKSWHKISSKEANSIIEKIDFNIKKDGDNVVFYTHGGEVKEKIKPSNERKVNMMKLINSKAREIKNGDSDKKWRECVVEASAILKSEGKI